MRNDLYRVLMTLMGLFVGILAWFIEPINYILALNLNIWILIALMNIFRDL